MSATTPSPANDALVQRLRVAADVLVHDDHSLDQAHPSDLLSRLVATVADDVASERVWLLMVALAARFPTPGEVEEATRTFIGGDTTDAAIFLLDFALAGAARGSAPEATMDLVTNRVLVDVDHSAKNDVHTGIQQVVRHLVPRWSAEHDIVPVAWTDRSGAYRHLGVAEERRVLRHFGGEAEAVPDVVESAPALVVPWHCVIVAAEVVVGDAANRLSGLAQYSGSALVAIGYDAIPVVSADLVPNGDTFVQYLDTLKYARTVAGISTTAVVEFAGFVDTLAAQGLVGPTVSEVALGTSPVSAPHTERGHRGVAMVVMVGSMEPRKNHLAVLHAAERLWRRGVKFELTFICGSEWGTEIPERIDDLTRAGRPITVHHKADDALVEESYRRARFSIFVSKHEGYGLPIVESLAAGTPVITSDFGCMLELSKAGGTLVVDPHDDAAIEDAMFTLLSDDQRLEELRAQIALRPWRSWDDYAEDLWATLVVPHRSADPTKVS